MTPDGGLPDGRVAVPLSAHRDDLVADDARAILDYLGRHSGDVRQIAAQVLATRRIRRHRAVIRAADRAELTAGLRAVADGAEHPLVARSSRRSTGRTAYVFPGQGSQWPGMGADAYRQLPAYRGEADRVAAAFRTAGLPSPLSFLTTPADREQAPQIELQGAQFVHSVALAAVWRACGILPDLTIGHSLGEVAAAYVAEAISLPDAVAVVAARAQAIASIPGSHGVAVLGVDVARAEELIAETPGWLELSAVNATSSVAVSGERRAIAAIVGTASSRGSFARELAMSFPAHTTAMDTQRDEFVRKLPDAQFVDAPVQFVGSATGDLVTAGTAFRPYWYANLRNTIRFDQAVQTAIGCGARTFLEMSAHPSLLFAVEDAMERTAEGQSAVLAGSGRRDEPVAGRLAANITAAAVEDPGYRWADLLADRRQPLLRGFPGAPMRAEHLWATPEPLPPTALLTVTAETWQRHELRPPCAVRSVAVLDLGQRCALAAALGEAATRHESADVADPAEADVIVAVAPRVPGADAATTVAALADAVDGGLLGYADAIGGRTRDVWLLTAGAERVLVDDPVTDLAQAGLAAMHRCVGFEHPDQNFHHLDLAAEAEAVDAALDAILRGSGELAIRGDAVYRRALGDDASSAPPWSLSDGTLDDVVITGGSGAIGLSYARVLAAHGAQRITLLSRRGVTREVLDEIRGGRDAEIVAPSCDLTDPGQVRAAARAAREASLIVHAAGTATFADRKELTGAALAGMSAAKIGGLDTVVNLWPVRRDARILLCSSVTGVWGGRSVAAYAAANRMLDAMADRLRADGRRCTAVRWGLWKGSGIVDAAEIARVERAGLRPMDPEQAVSVSLHDHRSDPVVLAADPERIRVFFGAGTPEPATGVPAVEDSRAAETPDAVRRQLADVLDVDAATLDLDSSLFDLGVDSLLALDLRKRLKRLTGRTVPLATLLGGITGTDLITEISNESGFVA